MAHVCSPSWADLMALAERHEPMGFIQCDRYAIVPFFPIKVVHPDTPFVKPHS